MTWIDKSVLDKRWFQELLILVVAFLLSTLNTWNLFTNWQDAQKAIVIFFITYGHAQANRFSLLPLLLRKHKSVAYLNYSLLLVLFFGGVLYLVYTRWFHTTEESNLTEFQQYLIHVVCCVLSLVTMLTPFLLLHFYAEQKKQVAAQLAMNQMELKVLQSQLNPHFLFNTFNNLYGISLQDPSRVSELILQVSNLMRYQLESHTRHMVTLEEELKFIEGYIALEEERLGRRCTVKYEYINETGSTSSFIAPLLLIAYIENAFKHGTDSLESSFVQIAIFAANDMINMKIVNSILPERSKRTDFTGIGLKNAEHRLNLLYDGQYTLDIKSTSDVFTIQLALPLIKDQHAA
jgi:sensor histidine kinase YesM